MLHTRLEETHLQVVRRATSTDLTHDLDCILDALDQLHNMITDDGMSRQADISDRETISLLRDVIYTAQETINEIEARQVTQMPILQLVEHQEKIG
ncbi:MAG: hypothetical protein KC546_05580 [Anaerolineae bacterium]|nr:hypothetical protein [Anaerolineae bacterium]MCA9887819.1 hypothetical protein [Anaerolineae bacterium]MCA9894516.1 hypothetical protein [Anaerolineae bacterium]MCB9458953.1 hypothetical protein [Anaerolineaceae bacterium]